METLSALLAICEEIHRSPVIIKGPVDTEIRWLLCCWAMHAVAVEQTREMPMIYDSCDVSVMHLLQV